MRVIGVLVFNFVAVWELGCGTGGRDLVVPCLYGNKQGGLICKDHLRGPYCFLVYNLPNSTQLLQSSFLHACGKFHKAETQGTFNRKRNPPYYIKKCNEQISVRVPLEIL